VDANDSEHPENDKKSPSGGPDNDISRDFTPQNAYHVRLVAPQIQMQSEKNLKNAVLVTAKGMQLKVIQIMDKDRLTDEISGLVQRRFTGGMDSVQIYVTSSQTFSSEFLDMYSANRYGAKAGSSWPPWVPLEVMFEPNVDPYGFSRVIERTSARLRFDKFNTLRLKYNDDVTTGQTDAAGNLDNTENRIDHLWVDFPELHAICDSTQYYALYMMVVDLLMYSEPLEKTRSERLEKMMLASDFSDLNGAPEIVIKLQEKIRVLMEIKMMFQVNEKTLSRQQWKERILLEKDLATCESELFFIMKAITTSQRRFDERAQASQQTGQLRWEIFAKELVWHLLRGSDEHLVELQLRDAAFNRTDNTDGSNENTMEIGDVLGFNLLPNATYPQIIAPFDEDPKDGIAKGSDEDDNQSSRKRRKNILTVHWFMLEAIAGIPVVERFEVDIHPLKIQLEREVGEKVFEYVFPNNNAENKDDSPFLIKHMLPSTQEEDEEAVDQDSPTESSHTVEENGLLQPNDGLTGAGDLSLRLQPTMTLPDNRRPRSEGKGKASDKHGASGELLRFRHFTKESGTELRKWTVRPKKETDVSSVRPISSRTPSTLSQASASTDKELDLRKRFAMRRSNSTASKAITKQNRSDDLNEMLSRASKYMTIAYVKIPSMVLCLSYKGKGQRNIVTDVHDLVFRMPTLEYRNKTWSNLDLFMQLKKEVMHALFTHAGAIVGNKFTHLRTSKLQQGRLRDLANSSILLGSSTTATEASGSTFTHSDTGTGSSREVSLLGEDDDSDSDARPSFNSQRPRSEWSQNEDSVHSSTPSTNGLQITPPTKRPWTSGTLSSSLSAKGGESSVRGGRASSIADSEVRFFNS
jgi:hypothetical protein